MLKESLAVAAGVAGVAVVAGVLFAIAQFKKSGKEDDVKNEKIYVDELNMGVIKSWFKDRLTDQGKKGVIFYPAKENLEKWKLNIEYSDHELIQVVYDEQNNKIIAYREISFSEISERLSELLDSNGGTIVVDR